MYLLVKQVCVEPRPLAVNMTLLTFAAERSAAAAAPGGRRDRLISCRRAHSSKPAARCCSEQMGQTVGRTP